MCNCTSCAQVNELPQRHCGDSWEGTLFSWLHIYYAYFTSVQFEQSGCYGSLMTNHSNLYYAPCLELDEGSLDHWSHQCALQSHCGDTYGDTYEGTLFSWLYIYIYMHIYIYYIYMMYNNIHDGYTYTKTCKEQWTVNKNIKISE